MTNLEQEQQDTGTKHSLLARVGPADAKADADVDVDADIGPADAAWLPAVGTAKCSAVPG